MEDKQLSVGNIEDPVVRHPSRRVGSAFRVVSVFNVVSETSTIRAARVG